MQKITAVTRLLFGKIMKDKDETMHAMNPRDYFCISWNSSERNGITFNRIQVISWASLLFSERRRLVLPSVPVDPEQLFQV